MSELATSYFRLKGAGDRLFFEYRWMDDDYIYANSLSGCKIYDSEDPGWEIAKKYEISKADMEAATAAGIGDAQGLDWSYPSREQSGYEPLRYYRFPHEAKAEGKFLTEPEYELASQV